MSGQSPRRQEGRCRGSGRGNLSAQVYSTSRAGKRCCNGRRECGQSERQSNAGGPCTLRRRGSGVLQGDVHASGADLEQQTPARGAVCTSRTGRCSVAGGTTYASGGSKARHIRPGAPRHIYCAVCSARIVRLPEVMAGWDSNNFSEGGPETPIATLGERRPISPHATKPGFAAACVSVNACERPW